MEATELILLLQSVPGVGERTVEAVLRRNAILRRSPDEFLHLSSERIHTEVKMRRESAETLLRELPDRRERACEEARFLRRNGVTVINILEAAYPTRLMERLEEPPPVLFCYGNSALLSCPLYAVVNSNDATEGALACADAAAALALECGWSPVTGHNRHAYQRTALVARRTGGKVCYVLDRGLLSAFGADLSRQLFPAAAIWSPCYDPDSDLTISPFGLRDPEIGENNRRRDALIIGLAEVILVGQARPRGQMESVCRSALMRGQRVLLVGPPCEMDERLISLGAQTVREESHLAETLMLIDN